MTVWSGEEVALFGGSAAPFDEGKWLGAWECTKAQSRCVAVIAAMIAVIEGSTEREKPIIVVLITKPDGFFSTYVY